MLQRLGRTAIRHPRRTLLVWLLGVAVGVAGAPALFSSLTSDMGGGDSSESARTDERRDELFSRLPPGTVSRTGTLLIGLVDGLRVDDPQTEAAVRRAASAIVALPGVASVVDAYDSGDPGLVADDREASLVLVTLEPGADETVEATLGDVQRVLEQTGAPRVLVGHEDMVDDEIEAQAEEDLARGEMVALPIAFAALVVVFGGVLAAALPLALAFVSVAGALLVLLVASATGDVAVYAINVVTMFGIGVGVDYGLVVVSRFREERTGSVDDVRGALDRTIATAGRTVAFSGLTVAVSLAGLLLFDSAGLRSLAVGGIGVVLVAVLAGLTLLPALLAVVGHRIRPARRRHDRGPFWHLAGWVRRFALPLTVVIGAGLIAVGIPFFGARFENPDARSLPESSVARQLDAERTRFGTSAAEALEVLASTTPDDPALAEWITTVAELDGVSSVDVDETLASAGAAIIEVVPTGQPQGEVAQRLVGDVRHLNAPFETLVGGEAAELVDIKATIAARLPWALAIVGLATIILLFLMTGSVVVAFKAVVMNVLSLGAMFGALVLIFQDGYLSELLGFDPVGALDATVPLVMFLFAFGLSMDYEVFLLARIKEAWDATGDNDRAIAEGLDRTGRIITSAALLLVIVFAGFAAGELVLIKQMGVGLAIAVIVDATIVRSLLVPATMTLMGRYNWWAPAPLQRIHARFGLHERVAVGRMAHVGTEPQPSKYRSTRGTTSR
jgi:putative drug exporter of the RND superfamily